MSGDPQKIERLTTMAERLIAALEADIAALKAGRPQDLRTTDLEFQRLSALYGREAAGLDLERVKAAPEDQRRRLVAATSRFRDLLQLHARVLTTVRNTSEGLVKAVAEEVERIRAPMRTYAPVARPRPSAGAMVYNSVI